LFLTSYLLEIILSVDNIFVWFLIFKSLNIPIIYQKKVLLYGSLGAFLLRFIFSFFGFFLFSRWHWILYFFGGLFVFISFKTFFLRSKKQNENEKINVIFYYFYKIFRISENVYCEKFFLKINNKIFFTPLFLSLVLIEFSDIIFSADSIPAIFTITNNLFIILTSNIFAVLGLRSMYLFIVPIIKKFPIFEYALSFILMFIGCKILFEKFIIISTFLTFSIILIILIIAFTINMIFYKKE